jgi:uncharacterized protein (DUF488 family)
MQLTISHLKKPLRWETRIISLDELKAALADAGLPYVITPALGRLIVEVIGEEQIITLIVREV